MDGDIPEQEEVAEENAIEIVEEETEEAVAEITTEELTEKQIGKAVEYPAAYDEVLAVGSTDTTGNKVENSCDGEEIEIFAPGSQIPTTGLFGGVSVVEGTSIAAAQAGLLDISNAAVHFEELEEIYTEKQTAYRKIQDDNGDAEEDAMWSW